MAKISLNKLVLVKKKDAVSITINDIEVMVQQYLPIEMKLSMLQEVLNAVLDDTGYTNPVRLEVFFNILLIKYYTNITITEAMLQDPSKTYDILVLNHILTQVIAAIPEEEYNDIFSFISEALENVNKYNCSALGLLRNILLDYKNTEIDVEKLTQALGDPEQLTLVKNILDKLG